MGLRDELRVRESARESVYVRAEEREKRRKRERQKEKKTERESDVYIVTCRANIIIMIVELCLFS